MNARISPACALLLLMGTAAAQRVDNAEYFWDMDPGAGSATPMSALDGAYNDAVEAIFLQTSALPGLGAHTLGIRVKDQQSNWGPTFTTVVVIEPPVATAPEVSVTQAEYFWDTDPGQGSGVPMIAFDGDFNSALEAIAMQTSALPGEGVHVLHARAKDANGAWSLPFRVVVDVLGGVATFPEVRVTAAEYYVNDDPGPGLGAPMLAVDGGFDQALEAIKGGDIPVPVTAGVNVLWMRARDANQAWGPSFGVVVNIDTTITGTTALPSGSHPPDFALAPNPAGLANGFDVIIGQSLPDAELRLIDGLGQVVLTQRLMGDRRMHVAVADLAPGVYFAALLSPQGTRTKRLVLQ